MISQEKASEAVRADGVSCPLKHRTRGHIEVHPRDQHRDVRFIERGGVRDEIAEMLGGALGVTREEVHGAVALPPAEGGKPARHGEMRKGHHRLDLILVAGGQHPPVVV